VRIISCDFDIECKESDVGGLRFDVVNVMLVV